MRSLLAGALALAVGSTAAAAPDAGPVNVTIWSSPVFASRADGLQVAATNIDFNGAALVEPFNAVRVQAWLQIPYDDLLNFTVISDGTVRLWVNDFLIVDVAAPNTTAPATTMPGRYGVPVQAGALSFVQVDYTRYAGPGVLTLQWCGNVTAPGLVPASAFVYAQAPARFELLALRDRLSSPLVPWQTFKPYSMSAHILYPLGVGFDVALLDTRNGEVFSQPTVSGDFVNAYVRAGPHSFNGSDYTQLNVTRWGPRNCTVSYETTILDGVHLAFLATFSGSDCAGLQFLLTPVQLWDRALFSTSTAAVAASILSLEVINDANVSAHVWPPANAACSNTTATILCVDLQTVCSPGTPCYVMYTTGRTYGLATVQAAIAAAASRQATPLAAYGNLSDVYDAIRTVNAWNTLAFPQQGVITTISRNWGGPSGYVLACWDTAFDALMWTLDGGVAKDIGYANLIQIVLSRTTAGFVPNIAQGIGATFDRSEPQVSSIILLSIYNKWQDLWLVQLLFDSLYSWHTWIWERRRGEGSAAPPGQLSDLIVLGSDPNQPVTGDGSINHMQGARYESGLDNSPMYDGPDLPQGGPVTFDNVTHHMQLYDAGATGLFVADALALARLANIIGRNSLAQVIYEHAQAVMVPLQAVLWQNDSGILANVLFNGTAYPRYGPTQFYAMASGLLDESQVASMVEWLASPKGFCLNDSYTGAFGAATTALFALWNGTAHQMCSSDTCIDQALLAGFSYVDTEAVLSTAAGFNMSTMLQTYACNDGTSITTAPAVLPPPTGCAPAGDVAWCSPVQTSAAPADVTLWFSAATADYQVCGTATCTAAAIQGNYTLNGTLCWAADAMQPENLPCTFGGPSIHRADPAFYDNAYWRGRIWGPQLQLLYWALQQYPDIPEAVAARESLVRQGRRLLLRNWNSFRQVNENYNAIMGVGSDGAEADAFYHWGALAGYLSLLDAGFY